jgi:hypothetical protein
MKSDEVDLELFRVCPQTPFAVMPDLIRHPESFENTGFRLSPE